MATKPAKPKVKTPKKKKVIRSILPTYQPKDKVKAKGKIGSRKREQPLSHRPLGTAKRLTPVEKLMIAADKQANPEASYTQIAHRYGISISTAHVICNDEELKTKLATVEGIKKGMAADYHLTASAMLGSITPGDITKINAYQRVIAAAAATDKALNIERGAPPSQVNQIQVNVQLNELQSEIAAMINKATTGNP